MDEMELLVRIYRPMLRQGPGSSETTRRAIELAGLSASNVLRIADIGCGTGAASIQLAKELDANVVAVDFLEPFLAELSSRAAKQDVGDRITTVEASMEDLPFADAQFDVIWSEGAIYNMGFTEGVQAWRRFLKPGGLLVCSEITWTTAERPLEIEEFWNGEYPQIDLASAKIGVLEKAGYSPRGYFVLPDECWTEGFYGPLTQRLDAVGQEYAAEPETQAIIAAQRAEIDLYRRFGGHYGYGLYIASLDH